MTTAFRSAVLLAVAGFAVGCAPRGDSPEEMIAAAEALDQRFVTAFNQGDVDGMMDAYWNSPEMVSMTPDTMVSRGWQEARAGVVSMLHAMPDATLEIVEGHNVVVGDAVIGWGLWEVTMSPAGGEPMKISGRFTDVKAKRDGQWVYLMDHASVPLPPPVEPVSRE